MRRVHQRSRGVPRRINLLADRALLGAYADGVARVDQAIVDKAAAEVFGPDERVQALRRIAPWAIGAAAGAALATGAALWLTRDRAEPPPRAAQAASTAAPKATAATNAAASPARTASASAAAVTMPGASGGRDEPLLAAGR